MQDSHDRIGFHVSAETQKIAIYSYLFLVALYFLSGSAHLINVFLRVADGNVGAYFELISTSTDRLVVYTLGFVTVFPIALRNRRVLLILVLASFPVGYVAPLLAIDVLPLLASFSALVWFLTSPQLFSTVGRRKAISLVVTYSILVLVAIEVATMICWFTFPFNPELSQTGPENWLVNLETKTFLLAGSLAPVLAVVFLFSWATRPFELRDSFLRRFAKPFTQDKNSSDEARPKKKAHMLLLMCPIILSFLVALYPYLPRLNVDMHPTGVDFSYYEGWLANSTNQGFFSVVAGSFFNYSDRPLSMMALYLAKYTTGLPASVVVQLSPLILCPILVLAVYFFMRESDGLGSTASYAMLLTASSFQITVGMFAFFLANWMALIELFLFMGCYFSSLRKKSWLLAAAALLLSISMLFTHAWTWGMAIGALILYLILILASKRKRIIKENRLEVETLILLILTNALVGIARNYMLGLSAGNFETVQAAQSTVSIGALGSFWNDLVYTFMQGMEGFFVNPIALVLAVIGGLIVALGNKPVNRYLTSWLVVSSIAFALSSGWTMKSRILFNAPFPVFEALGLIGITHAAGRFSEPSVDSSLKLAIILFVLLATLNYAFRCAFVISQT